MKVTQLVPPTFKWCHRKVSGATERSVVPVACKWWYQRPLIVTTKGHKGPVLLQGRNSADIITQHKSGVTILCTGNTCFPSGNPIVHKPKKFYKVIQVLQGQTICAGAASVYCSQWTHSKSYKMFLTDFNAIHISFEWIFKQMFPMKRQAK